MEKVEIINKPERPDCGSGVPAMQLENDRMKETVNGYWKNSDVAKHTGMSPAWISLRAKDGTIPAIRTWKRGQFLFKPEAVRKWWDSVLARGEYREGMGQ